MADGWDGNGAVNLSDFHFDLPEDLIAQHPSPTRDGSRLMVLARKDETIAHHIFRDVCDFFNPGDCLVLNETRVFPARLHGFRPNSGGAIEVLLLRPDGDCWEAMVKERRLRLWVLMWLLLLKPYWIRGIENCDLWGLIH
jgi:S-adenosylmethionine:tRNA ribosyltransferase-isomerase